MTDSIFHLYDIVVPDWEFITPHHVDQLFQWLVTSSWIGEPGNRAGFVKMARHESAIGGLFASEGLREAKQYSDAKILQERREPSFQEVFFAIFVDEGQLLLQERRIYDYVDLSMDVIRRQFLSMLADGIRSIGVRVGKQIKYEDAGGEWTQEDLITFFRANVVQSVEITKLSGSVIPENIVDIFNPRAEWMPVMRGIVAETLQKGLDQVKMTTDGSGEADLGHSPIPYALAAAGQIEKIEACDEVGRVVYREKFERGELRMEIPVKIDDSKEILIRLMERLDAQGRKESAELRKKKRKQSQLPGPLFDQGNY